MPKHAAQELIATVEAALAKFKDAYDMDTESEPMEPEMENLDNERSDRRLGRRENYQEARNQVKQAMKEEDKY